MTRSITWMNIPKKFLIEDMPKPKIKLRNISLSLGLNSKS